MERTKTLQQIQQQKHRMLCNKQAKKRVGVIVKTYVRYMANILNHFNVVTNREYWDIYGTPVPASVYAKQTEV